MKCQGEFQDFSKKKRRKKKRLLQKIYTLALSVWTKGNTQVADKLIKKAIMHTKLSKAELRMNSAIAVWQMMSSEE